MNDVANYMNDILRLNEKKNTWLLSSVEGKINLIWVYVWSYNSAKKRSWGWGWGWFGMQKGGWNWL